MTLSRKAVIVLSLAGVALGSAVILFVASVVFLPRQYAAEQSVERSFIIDEDFTAVRKILVRTDAAKRIITMTGDSEFVDQQWTAVGGGLESLNLLDPRWRLELHGMLRLRTLDEYVGRNEILLSQVVNIDPDQLHSEVELKKGSERLLDYQMTTWFARDEAGEKTRVVQRLKQEILTDAPWFAHAIADYRVRASANKALVNQERAIRKVIEDNRHQRWLLPLR
jgi:hypothetical protein